MWGEYPALLPGSTNENPKPEDIVYGVAYEVQAVTERDRLVAYETDAYRVDECWVELGDGDGNWVVVMGKTFVWDGRLEELREGRFDFRDWVLKRKEFECSRSL